MSEVRAKNMELRRQRILDAAREIIVEKGIDGLTTRGLAEAAGVTAPTLYNLIGGKKDIIRAMVVRSAESFKDRVKLEEASTALEWIETIVRAATDPEDEGPEYLRAMIISSDRIAGTYAAEGDGGSEVSRAGQISIEVLTTACKQAIAKGYLRGNIPASELAQQLFICTRGPQRDWSYELIGTEEATRRVRRGFYLTIAADASQELRDELIQQITVVDDQRLHNISK